MKTILLIEDEAVLQKAVSDFLSQKGYLVKNALDGEIGLALAKKELPDIILLDLVMPKKNGLEVLSEIKKDVSTKNIPVIIFTNSEDLADIERGILDGAFAYLIKSSYSLQELEQKIKEALRTI